jgi:hypothetical protein
LGVAAEILLDWYEWEMDELTRPTNRLWRHSGTHAQTTVSP